MKKKRRLFILLVFVFLCTWFGFQAGTLAKGDESTRLAAYQGQEPLQFVQAVAPQPALPAEMRLLVVGVDQLADEGKSRLRSIWFAIYDAPQAKLVWYGVYPAVGPNGEEINRNLESRFKIEPNRRLSLEFQAALQAQHRLLWNNAILMDDKQVGQLVGLLDGIKLQGQAIDSRQAQAGLQVAAADARMARAFQTELIRGFCERRDELGGAAAAVAAGVEALTSGILPPPPGMWGEAQASDDPAPQRLQSLLKSNTFLPCEIRDYP